MGELWSAPCCSRGSSFLLRKQTNKQIKEEYCEQVNSNCAARLYPVVTFVIPSRESSPEGSSSSRFSVWDLLQIYLGVCQRLPVYMEHLTYVPVILRSAQDQRQLKEEDVEPLKGSHE